MLTLYSYPELFGVADNNPFGLKVHAFLHLCDLPFEHRHIFDARNAPRGQLPYLVDGEHSIGDSDAIINHLLQRYALTIDDGLTPEQRDIHLLIRRTLDDLYWSMSYSRWQDDRFWPQFRDALLRTHAELTEEGLLAARQYNLQRYHYQGIGRYDREQVYERGIASLRAISHLLGDQDCLFGEAPGSIDAALYGFVANIHFYAIDTPLRRFVDAQANLVRHCEALHRRVTGSIARIEDVG
ncbi:glutathione S-transferase family protein [Metapseudomonas resinovorans]|uniref:Glutathione S-transferase family protein n=1 Tax=Metapseudomonas resinovorans NBRC 106553 TaxID=1245471 RepID=S6ARD9_METRE|nr:glutathione S-transferase C-terminal domain-containing protein [Pseudomonas resinovorans]BAN48463.1 glutathione S-transferase family protein [Pseudomonas resinovorans NBRC 106553]